MEEETRTTSTTEYGDYDEAGVDLSLLRHLLQLTPLERLRQMERHARDTLILLDHGRRHREARTALVKSKP